MAIIGMMVCLSAVAVQGMSASTVQKAASQVMSGLSLARQVAITKNTQAALLIADQTNSGFPSEPFRYWSLVYSNKSSGKWEMAKDWEELPPGTFILETRKTGSDYNAISGNPLSADYAIGAVTPDKFSYASFSINGTSIANTDIPCIQFNSSGAVLTNVGNAIRIVVGSVLRGNATLTSTNLYYFVETDKTIGRIRLRSPESYSNP